LGHETKKFIPFKTYNLFDPARCPDFCSGSPDPENRKKRFHSGARLVGSC
jgi:hypothetical protein